MYRSTGPPSIHPSLCLPSPCPDPDHHATTTLTEPQVPASGSRRCPQQARQAAGADDPVIAQTARRRPPLFHVNRSQQGPSPASSSSQPPQRYGVQGTWQGECVRPGLACVPIGWVCVVDVDGPNTPAASVDLTGPPPVQPQPPMPQPHRKGRRRRRATSVGRCSAGSCAT